jgi:hypothetical protein
MGARQKLNTAYGLGSLFVASLVGLVTQSWVVFVIALLVAIGCNFYLGEIRPKGPRR